MKKKSPTKGHPLVFACPNPYDKHKTLVLKHYSDGHYYFNELIKYTNRFGIECSRYAYTRFYRTNKRWLNLINVGV